MTIEGPAIVAEDETSTFLNNRFDATIAANGYLILHRKKETSA
jgi:hypothetical protein